MILSNITLVAPDGSSVELGQWDIDPNTGHASGYVATNLLFKPAPITVRRQKLPFFAGGIVAASHADLRDITVSGAVFGSSIEDANALWQQLLNVCGDPGGGFVSIRFQPSSSSPLLEMLGVVTEINPQQTSALEIPFDISFVSGSPYATATQISSTSGGTLVGAGNVPVYPDITLTATGTVDDIALSITHPNGQTDTLNLTGLGITSDCSIAISCKPGYEDILINGTTRAMRHRVPGSAWPTIMPGANTISATTSSAGLVSVAAVTWNDGWSL